MKKIIFCNNCGKNGHMYYQCKKPITSTGIIAIRKQKPRKYLMICRKDSLGYIDFIRGKYNLYDREYILSLINEMTEKEKVDLLSNDFDALWKNLWGGFVGTQYNSEENSSNRKFYLLKEGIYFENYFYSLENIIKESTTSWETPEWVFPKGRRNYQEDDKKCAMREFSEETGVHLNKIEIVNNIIPFEEIFTGSNYKTYRHKYFISILNEEVELNNFQRSEVSDLKWCTKQQCLDLIRPYNLERIEVLEKVDKIINSFILVR